MNGFEKIMFVIVIMTITTIFELIKYKYPLIFLNFGFDSESGNGYGVGSKFFSSDSAEVRNYKKRRKSNFIKLLIAELFFLTLFVIFF